MSTERLHALDDAVQLALEHAVRGDDEQWLAELAAAKDRARRGFQPVTDADPPPNPPAGAVRH